MKVKFNKSHNNKHQTHSLKTEEKEKLKLDETRCCNIFR